MPLITPPQAQWPIINKDGSMVDSFRIWSLFVSSLGILTGTGTPEGIIEARQTSLYMDDAGTPGSILYIKRDTDIAGDGTKGWILI